MPEQLPPNGDYEIISDFTEALSLSGEKIKPQDLKPKDGMILRITEKPRKPEIYRWTNNQWESISQQTAFRLLTEQMGQKLKRRLGEIGHPAQNIRRTAHYFREFLRLITRPNPKLNPEQIDTLLGLTGTTDKENYSRFIRYLVPDIKNISENVPLFHFADWREKPMWRPNIQKQASYPTISYNLSELQEEIKWHFLGGLRKKCVLKTLKQFPIKGGFLKRLFSKSGHIYPSNEFPLFRHFIGTMVDPALAKYTVLDCDAQNNPRPAVEGIIRHFGQPDNIFRSSLKFNKFTSYDEWGFHLYYLHHSPGYFNETNIFRHLKSRYKVEIYPLATKPICLPFGKGSVLLNKDYQPRNISFKDFLADFNEKI